MAEMDESPAVALGRRGGLKGVHARDGGRRRESPVDGRGDRRTPQTARAEIGRNERRVILKRPTTTADLDLRCEDATDVLPRLNERPPVIEENVDRPPHGDPAGDDEALTQDLPRVADRKSLHHLGEGEQPDKHRKTNRECHMAEATLLPEAPIHLLAFVFEVGTNGSFNLRDGQGQGGWFLQEQHELQRLRKGDLLGGRIDVIDGILIEIPFAEGRRVTAIEELPRTAEPDVDADLIAFDAVPRGLRLGGHGSSCLNPRPLPLSGLSERSLDHQELSYVLHRDHPHQAAVARHGKRGTRAG